MFAPSVSPFSCIKCVPREISKKYASHCIIVCVLMCICPPKRDAAHKTSCLLAKLYSCTIVKIRKAAECAVK